VVKAKAGEDGKLFGSIGTRDVVVAIEALGQKIERSEILLPNGNLRQTGDYEIQLQLHGDLKILIKLSIIAAEA